MKKRFFWPLVAIIFVALIGWFIVTSLYDSLSTPTPAPDISNSVPESWLSANTSAGIFRYPENLGTEYISIVDWPPALRVYTEVFSCTEAGEETARAGRTDLLNIGGTQYCRTTLLEGAAGSTYGQYAYAFGQGSTTAILTFSLRFPQCMNYDDPRQSECLAERNSFDLDSLVHRIAQSVELSNN